MNPESGYRWTAGVWLEEVTRWLRERLNAQGISLIGPVEQTRIRPWATICRVPTDAGPFYFKASARQLAYEAAVSETLARLRPDCLLPVVAADPSRGWLLMPDGGTTLRDVLRQDRDLDHWQTLLDRYAELQIATAAEVDLLIKQGVPDARLATLPGQLKRLLDIIATEDHPEALTTAELRRLRSARQPLADLSQELAAFGLPATIEHGDLHDGNVFLKNGRYLIFDWGDSAVSHPFFSLRVTLVSLDNSLGYGANTPELSPLIARYLRPWTAYLPRSEALRALELARRLAPIVSALRWHRAISILSTADRRQYAGAIPNLMRELLELNGVE